MGNLDAVSKRIHSAKEKTGRAHLAKLHGETVKRTRRRPNETVAVKDSTFVVTTFRVQRQQYEWLKRQAVERALKLGNKPDASVLVREGIELLMKRSR
jgi:hypothetical protein